MSSSLKSQHRIQLEPGNFDRLQELANRLGYVHRAGPGAGKVGSVSTLMDAIAAGEVEVFSLVALPIDVAIQIQSLIKQFTRKE